MEKPLSADSEEISSFDLVELVESHENHQKAARGTVVLMGGCDPLVDFARGYDAQARVADSPRCAGRLEGVVE